MRPTKKETMLNLMKSVELSAFCNLVFKILVSEDVNVPQFKDRYSSILSIELSIFSFMYNFRSTTTTTHT